MVERTPASLLSAYRDAAGPPPAIEQRMLDVLHTQLTVPPPSGGPPSSAGGAPAGGTGSATAGAASVSGAKLAVVLTIVGGLAAATPWLRASLEPAPPREAVLVVDTSPPSPELAPAPVLVPVMPAAAPPDSTSVELADPAAAPDTTPGSALAEPAPDHVTAPRRRGAPRARSAAPSPTLADEAQLLRSADAALRQGRLSEARALLDRHARAFGAASLQAEAELLELLLACAERHPDAQARATAWLTRQGAHPARTRILELCEAAAP